MLLLFLCAGGLFCGGLLRVHRVRHEYQVSVALRQRERELHYVQRAYWALEAYVAVQQVRDQQRAELSKVSPPAFPARRPTRS